MPNTCLDKDGFTHDRINPSWDATENRILYTATRRILHHETFGIRWGEVHEAGAMAMLKEHERLSVEGMHYSHDNATAAMAYFKYFGMPSPVPIFSKQRLHPRDIVLYGYAKYPKLFWILLPIPVAAMLFSCSGLQPYKVRGGNKILKTDGIILTFIRTKALKLDWTFKACTWLLERNEYFGNWYSVFKEYFRRDNHPIPKLVEAWEDSQ